MSFVGLVTRKEKDTGVSLMAKVVTESKIKFARKAFKVKVKANALDDFTCCVVDHEAAVGKINQTQDMTSIIKDITLSYNGVNNTTVSYRIIDIETPKLSGYMTNDGKVTGRPKFGEGNATGYIEITVSKNEASLVSRILTSIKSTTADEVLNDATFGQMALWGAIRGTNDSYIQGSEWSGHNNVMSKLNLVNSIDIAALSTNPVGVTWSVKDDTLSYASALNIYTEARINAGTGDISRCAYKDACKLVDGINGITVKVIAGVSASDTLQNRVRIGGITLTASLTLGTVIKNVVFNCSTVSKYLTNTEVMDVVLNNICLFRQDYSTNIEYKEVADATFETIVAPSVGGSYVLRSYGNKGSLLFAAPELKIAEGGIIGVSITNNVYDYAGAIPYTDAGLLATAFDGGFQADDGESYMKLTLNFAAFKAATIEKRKFACNAKISISGYSSTGDTPGGSPLISQRFAQIVVDTAAMV